VGWYRRRRRRRLRRRPLPLAWRSIVERNVRLYPRLSPDDRRELEGHIQVFLAEKRFEGAGGLRITDEIRVTTAAHACLLLLHRTTDYFPGLRSIIVYPGDYVASRARRDTMGVVTEGWEARRGESWSRGAIVLSWDSVRAAASDVSDCRNVVLHEFAHQLDGEDGAVDGAPRLPDRSRYVAWARVLGEEYDRLRRDSAIGRPTVLDRYGATSPAEFFAVATECFFARPKPLRARHPELYDELKSYYRQDPAAFA